MSRAGDAYSFLVYIEQNGGLFSDWYAGIATDPKDRLASGHGVSGGDKYEYVSLPTSDDARVVEQVAIEGRLPRWPRGRRRRRQRCSTSTRSLGQLESKLSGIVNGLEHPIRIFPPPCCASSIVSTSTTSMIWTILSTFIDSISRSRLLFYR